MKKILFIAMLCLFTMGSFAATKTVVKHNDVKVKKELVKAEKQTVKKAVSALFVMDRIVESSCGTWVLWGDYLGDEFDSFLVEYACSQGWDYFEWELLP